MYDPTEFHSIMDSCVERTLSVDCPVRAVKANITIARWKMTDGELTPWTVVDCSLLPAGQVSCHVACLPEATGITE
jgi:hypothetical protein